MLKMKIKLGTYLILPRAWYSLEKWRGGERRRREGRGEEEEEVERGEEMGGKGRTRKGGEIEGRGGEGRRKERRGEGKREGVFFSGGYNGSITTYVMPYCSNKSCGGNWDESIVVYRYTPF